MTLHVFINVKDLCDGKIRQMSNSVANVHLF